jgi:hypothetical protein
MKNLAVFFLTAFAALAADVTGNWKATAEGPNGTMTRTLTLKAEGSKLTGETVSSFVGKSTIENGKIEGDNISFEITAKFQDNEMRIAYKGKVTGADSMTLTADVGGNLIEWKAARVK